ncbi:dihydrodipicolinate synthase family protein [Cetobacterium sp.]|uniref:dihydrodipicolinate synthase family protein n=1 Tax=Cetobacterium sp. TaxID=2071632 RepID=UPI003F34F7EF
MSKLKGVFPPVVTIFKKNGEIDLEGNKKQADFLISKGVTGLAYLGTSGEFFSLSLEEKKFFIQEMIKHVNTRAKILVGVGSTNKNEVREFIKFLENYNIDAILLINPYFAVYDEISVEDYYNEIAKGTKLNIIIYNFPQLTGFNFSPDLVARLIKTNNNIVGIKDTTPDQSHLIDMLKVKETNKDFIVYCAFESQALGALVNGVEGFINATANFSPELTVGLWESYSVKNWENCSKFYIKMCDAMDIYKLSSPLLLACKEAVYQRVLKYDGGERKPSASLNIEKKEIVKKILKKIDLT